MEKFFIMKEGGKQEVEGKRLTITVNGLNVCQAFVTDYGIERTGHRFVISELSTGYRVGYGQSEKAAYKNAVDRIAFAGIERFSKMVEDGVSKHGRAN